MNLETISEHGSFGGKVGFFKHASPVNHCDMRFSVFVPPRGNGAQVPANPVNGSWGRKAFSNYLGEDRSAWAEYDASELARSAGSKRPAGRILVDQGLNDQYLEQELHPERFEAACAESGIELELRRHPGYDHGYYFISTFMEDHLRHHAAILCG